MSSAVNNPFLFDPDVVPPWSPDIHFKPPSRSDQAIARVPQTVENLVSEVVKQYLAHTYDGIPLIEILRAVDRALCRREMEANRQNILVKVGTVINYTVEQLFYDPLGVLTWSVIEEMALIKGLQGINVNRLKDAMADLVDMNLLTKPAFGGGFSLVRTSHLTEVGQAVLKHIQVFELSANPLTDEWRMVVVR